MFLYYYYTGVKIDRNAIFIPVVHLNSNCPIILTLQGELRKTNVEKVYSIRSRHLIYDR